MEAKGFAPCFMLDASQEDVVGDGMGFLDAAIAAYHYKDVEA